MKDGFEAVIAVVKEERFKDGKRENAEASDDRTRNIVRWNWEVMSMTSCWLLHSLISGVSNYCSESNCFLL